MLGSGAKLVEGPDGPMRTGTNSEEWAQQRRESGKGVCGDILTGRQFNAILRC